MAFTLIESILTIALIAILIALLLPSLSGVRDRVRSISALSDLRQHATVFAAYANDHRDISPFFAEPRATLTVIRGNQATVSFHYFSSSSFWVYALADTYYPGLSLFDDVFRSPYLLDTDVYDTPYYYSCSMIAAPAYWSPETRTGRDQFRPNRLSDVAFPGAKGMLTIEPWVLRAPFDTPLSTLNPAEQTVLSATVAGSATTTKLGEFGPVIASGDGGTITELGGHRTGTTPAGMHTLHGAAGRDLP